MMSFSDKLRRVLAAGALAAAVMPVGAAVWLATAAPAQAEQRAKSAGRDARIRTFTYHPNDVYRIDAKPGYIVTVLFAPDEDVIDVEAGDSLSWQFNTLTQRNRFSFKPTKYIRQPTNLTAHTSKAVYTFFVHAANMPDDRAGLRYEFQYPEAEAAMQAAEAARPMSSETLFNAARMNASYYAAGDAILTPIQAFDDGARTIVKLPAGAARPAVFALEADNAERLVNTSDLPDGAIVVSGVYPRLVLRDGPYEVCLFNRPLYERTKDRPRAAQAPIGFDGGAHVNR